MSCKILTSTPSQNPKTPREILEDFILCWGDTLRSSDKDYVYSLREMELWEMEAAVRMTQEETEFGFITIAMATLKYSTRRGEIFIRMFRLNPSQTQKV